MDVLSQLHLDAVGELCQSDEVQCLFFCQCKEVTRWHGRLARLNVPVVNVREVRKRRESMLQAGQHNPTVYIFHSVATLILMFAEITDPAR